MNPSTTIAYPPERFPWERVLPGIALVGVTLYGVAQVATPIAGLLYLAVYFAVAWQSPVVALMLVFACAPFPYDISPGVVRFSLAELNLLICTIVLLFKQGQGLRPLRFGPIVGPAAAYIGVCIVAGLVNPHGKETLKVVIQMGVYLFAAVAVFASSVDHKRDLLPALYALLMVGCFQAVLTISGYTYSIGIHKNAAGASLAGIFIVAFELWFAVTDRRAKWTLTAVIMLTGAGLIMSLSRGAWVGAAVGCGIVMAMRRQYTMLFRLSLLSLPVIAICWQMLPENAREYAFNIEATAHNSIGERYENAEKFWTHFENSPILGEGTGLRKKIDATNVVLSTLAETGVIGLAAFTWIFWRFFRMIWWAQKRVARHDPLYSLLAIGAGLMFARLGHGMFDHYWSRGALTAAWSAAGMATLAYLTVQAREEAEAEEAVEAEPTAEAVQS